MKIEHRLQIGFEIAGSALSTLQQLLMIIYFLLWNYSTAENTKKDLFCHCGILPQTNGFVIKSSCYMPFTAVFAEISFEVSKLFAKPCQQSILLSWKFIALYACKNSK